MTPAPPVAGRRSAGAVLLAILAVLVISAGAGLAFGALELEPRQLLQALLAGPDEGGSLEQTVVWQLRLPRILVGCFVGAALALAGVLLQGLFRNELAAPGVVGTSAGAALGAVCTLAVGLADRFPLLLPLGAMLGALLSLQIVARIARHDGRTSITDLLLAGVALNAFLSAVNSLLIARSWANFEVARRINFWLMGGITDREWLHVALVVPGLAIGLAMALWFGRDLDLLLHGEDLAEASGVHVEQLKRWLLLVVSLLVGSAVAVSGVVGFVGLVIPHLIRLLIGPNHRPLIVLSAAAGGAFVLLADLVARMAVRPAELQLGIVTAFVGAPFFVLLLVRQRRRREVPT